MAPPLRTGINTVTRKASDGTTTRHYYDRRTKRYLGTDRDQAIAAATEAPRTSRPAEGTFDAVAIAYLGSTKFRNLSPKAQKLNRLYVDQLRGMYGALPIGAITRRVVMALGEQHAARPWYSTHLLSKLRLVMQHAVDMGLLQVNPAARPGGMRPQKRHAIWTHAQTEAMLAAVSPDIRLACGLLLYTAQRPSDSLAMTWNQVREMPDGRMRISLRQAKTGELVDVLVHRELQPLIAEAMERRAAASAGEARSKRQAKRAESLLLVPSPTGLPWAYRNFSRKWDQAVQAAGITGVQRRDLRRTAMVRMAEMGLTPQQIAAVSGHTIDQTTRILDTYIPRRTEVATSAIKAWENGAVVATVVPMVRRAP